MQPAVQRLIVALSKAEIKMPKIPVISNVTGKRNFVEKNKIFPRKKKYDFFVFFRVSL